MAQMFMYQCPVDGEEDTIKAEEFNEIPMLPSSINTISGHLKVKFNFKLTPETDGESKAIFYGVATSSGDDSVIKDIVNSKEIIVDQKLIADKVAKACYEKDPFDSMKEIEDLRKQVLDSIVSQTFVNKILAENFASGGSGYIYNQDKPICTVDGIKIVNTEISASEGNSNDSNKKAAEVLLSNCFSIDNLLSYENLKLKFAIDNMVCTADLIIDKEKYQDISVKDVIANIKNVSFKQDPDWKGFDAVEFNIEDDDSVINFINNRKRLLTPDADLTSSTAADAVGDMFDEL